MPRKITYKISIDNVYTGDKSEYIVKQGDLNMVVDVVNRHFGCANFTSRSGINNFISRGKEKSPLRMSGITITKEK